MIPGPEQARQYLAAIALPLTVQGISCHLAQRGAPGLAIEAPGGAPNPVTVVISPGTGPGFWFDCTCIWTPPAAATPQDTAGTILAVLAAIRPGPAPGHP